MNRAWIVAAVLTSTLSLLAEDSARKAAPSYSAGDIVDSASCTPGALAPYSLATVFGKDLAFDTEQAGSTVRNELAGAGVFVGGVPAQLLYASPTQINFVVPSWLRPADVKIRVVRQGVTGPDVVVTLLEDAPQLFRDATGYAVAAHADYGLVTPDSPASPGELIILYASGLGATSPDLPVSGAPAVAQLIKRFADIRVLVNGAAVDQGSIAYAGVSPGSAGLYQVNVRLPATSDPDPEIRLAIGDQSSAAGLKLVLR